MQLILAEAAAEDASASFMDSCATHKLTSERVDHFVGTHCYPKTYISVDSTTHISVDSIAQALVTALVCGQALH